MHYTERWPTLEDLFGEQGPARRCWCMDWWIGAAYGQQLREANKAVTFLQETGRGRR